MKKSIVFLTVMLLFTYIYSQTNSDNKSLLSYKYKNTSNLNLFADNNSSGYNFEKRYKISENKISSKSTKDDDENAEEYVRKSFDFDGGFGAGFHVSNEAPSEIGVMPMINGNFTFWIKNFAPRLDFNLLLDVGSSGMVQLPVSLSFMYRLKPHKKFFDIMYPYVGVGVIYDYVSYDESASGIGINTILGFKIKFGFLEVRYSAISVDLSYTYEKYNYSYNYPYQSYYSTYTDYNNYNLGGLSVVTGFRF